MGIPMRGVPPLGVLENTAEMHHLVVCTLCSCYPRAVLGYPPFWFKSAAYRARAVRDPRGVLAEWGTVLPDGVRIRVVDSTADYRWMVLPLRPAGTEGWDEDAARRAGARGRHDRRDRGSGRGLIPGRRQGRVDEALVLREGRRSRRGPRRRARCCSASRLACWLSSPAGLRDRGDAVLVEQPFQRHLRRRRAVLARRCAAAPRARPAGPAPAGE